jgi:spermidine/putrescine transport system substrate-binding protein
MKTKHFFLVALVVVIVLVVFIAGSPKEEEPELGGELKILCWEGYDAPMQVLTEKYGIEIKPTYISNNDEIFTKLKAGAKYDVISPNHSVVPQLIDNDLIIPLDTSRIPNYVEIFPQFKDFDWNRRGDDLYTVIFTWGSNCINYNPELIDPIESWHELSDPAMKGKFVLLDDTIGVITAGAKALGIRENTNLLTEQQLDEVGELLKQWTANARAISPSIGEIVSMLVNKEVAMWASGWEAVDVWVQAEGVPLTHTYVKEGTLVFIDSYAICSSATNLPAAYEALNTILDAEVQAQYVAKDLSAAITNSKALNMMDSQLRGYYPYDSIDKFFAENNVVGPPPQEPGKYATYSDWVEKWEEVKAAQ